ncbi:hypothetical protein Tco_1157210 [Tanacetum coccineum]
MKRVIMDSVKPKVLAPGMYAIDVEPLPSHCRNNREVNLVYLNHLKESVETLREIVKEARVKRLLDRSLASACLYTKQSQELLAYTLGTCLKEFNKKDNKHAYYPLNRTSRYQRRTKQYKANPTGISTPTENEANDASLHSTIASANQ